MHENETEDPYSHKEPCPNCHSKDNLARYRSGSAFCFGCSYTEKGEGNGRTNNGGASNDYSSANERTRKSGMIEAGEIQSLNARNIPEATCRKFGYSVGEYFDKSFNDGEGKLRKAHIAPISDFRGKEIVAQKLRMSGKDFRVIGDKDRMGLFGQNVWRDSGKKIVITEGEIDALSVSAAQNDKWPVVSIPTGTKAAKKILSKCLRWLEQYEEIILMFDNDESGQDAVQECVGLFTPGKCKIAVIEGYKDANEAWKDNRSDLIIDAIWSAKTWKPETIFSVQDVLESGETELPEGSSHLYSDIDFNGMNGQRIHEMILYGAGTGCGKTDMVKRISAHNISTNKEKVGVILLEEPTLILTIDTIGGMIDECLYHDASVEFDIDKRDAARSSLNNWLFMHKTSGNERSSSILETIRFMVVSLGCRHIVLDHVTYLLDESGEGDLAATKQLMRSLNDINKELPFTLHYIAHLKKSDKPHEEGGRVTLNDFAGGKAITQYANYVFGIERDQQDPENKNRSVLRCLKDRMLGKLTGFCLNLEYNEKTGTKKPVEYNPFKPEEEIESKDEKFEF